MNIARSCCTWGAIKQTFGLLIIIHNNLLCSSQYDHSNCLLTNRKLAMEIEALLVRLVSYIEPILREMTLMVDKSSNFDRELTLPRMRSSSMQLYANCLSNATSWNKLLQTLPNVTWVCFSLFVTWCSWIKIYSVMQAECNLFVGPSIDMSDIWLHR